MGTITIIPPKVRMGRREMGDINAQVQEFGQFTIQIYRETVRPLRYGDNSRVKYLKISAGVNIDTPSMA